MSSKYSSAPLSKEAAHWPCSQFTKCAWMVSWNHPLVMSCLYHTCNHNQFPKAPFTHAIPFTLPDAPRGSYYWSHICSWGTEAQRGRRSSMFAQLLWWKYELHSSDPLVTFWCSFFWSQLLLSNTPPPAQLGQLGSWELPFAAVHVLCPDRTDYFFTNMTWHTACGWRRKQSSLSF